MALTTATAFNDVKVIVEVRHSMGVNAGYFPFAVAFFLEHGVTRRPCKTASTEEVAPSSHLGALPSHHPSNVQVSCCFAMPANVAYSIIANPDHHHQLHLLGYAHGQTCATALPIEYAHLQPCWCHALCQFLRL